MNNFPRGIYPPICIYNKIVYAYGKISSNLKKERRRVMKKLLVNIDFDGVLIPNHFEIMLLERLLRFELPPHISLFPEFLFEWYVKFVNMSSPAPLNIRLLKFFANNMDKYVLRLWTNRNLGLQEKTLTNLKPFKSIFDSFQFYGGKKNESKVEGVVMDNNPKYLQCGELGGILYKFK